MLEDSKSRLNFYTSVQHCCLRILTTIVFLLFYMDLKLSLSYRWHKLKVLKNAVLRKVFMPKRKELTGDLRKFYNEELYYLYSLNMIRLGKPRE